MAAPYAQQPFMPPQPQPVPMAAPGPVGGPVPVPAPVPAPAMFALLIPGRTLDTNFTLVDAKKMMIQVPAPTAITELTVCMLQPSIPADHGVAVYYALPPFTESVTVG